MNRSTASLLGRLRRRSGAAGLALATVATGVTLAVTVPADAAPSAAPAAPAAAAVLPNGFRSVGYMPSWSGQRQQHPVQQAHPHQLRVRAAELQRHPAGDPRPEQAASLVTLGHSNNVKVSLAIGGWNDGNDSAFEALAANAGARTTFVNSVMSAINQYGLDGVDIDWEYPDPGTSGNNFTALMQQLSNALHGQGKLLTAAVVSEGGTANGVQPAVFGMVDWLNIMAYDGGSPHANYDWSIHVGELLEGPRPAGQQDRARRAVLQPPRLPHLRASSSRWTRPTPTVDCINAAARSSATTASPRSSARPSGRWPTPAAS